LTHTDNITETKVKEFSASIVNYKESVQVLKKKKKEIIRQNTILENQIKYKEKTLFSIVLLLKHLLEKQSFKEDLLETLRYDVFSLLEETFNNFVELKPVSSITNYPEDHSNDRFHERTIITNDIDYAQNKKRKKFWDEQMDNLLDSEI